jgi:hypothetical protein
VALALLVLRLRVELVDLVTLAVVTVELVVVRALTEVLERVVITHPLEAVALAVITLSAILLSHSQRQERF